MTFITNSLGILAWGAAMFIAALPAGPPEKVYIYPHPLTQWTCTAQGEREYQHACAIRARMERIKPHG